MVLETGDADDGTNGANNAAVAAGMLQVVSLLPDLEIASVAGPATMGLGRPMTVPFTVRNTGLDGRRRVPREVLPGARLAASQPG